MSALFEPLRLKDITLRNRIAVPPMCQYSATEGRANAWHVQNYTAQARGGASLVIVEATAVAPEGRITPYCLGLWNDTQAQDFVPVVAGIKSNGAVPGIQIAHAGIKANANRPWEGDDHIAPDDPRAWKTIGPSPIRFSDTLPRVPHEMSQADILRVRQDFVSAAIRARDIGFEWLELHFAHGYLAQSFYSKETNHRQDQYGGSFENRSRFLRETFAAVREVWPAHLPLTIRFGVTEFNGHIEEDIAQAIDLTRSFKADGLDMMSVSIGFSTPNAQIPWGPAFLAPYAKRIRIEADIPVSSAWGFGEPHLAEAAVANGDLDLVMVGKAHLANPHWAYFAARELKVQRASWQLPAPYAHWLERY